MSRTIANAFREPAGCSDSSTISLLPAETLQDLLDAYQKSRPERDHLLSKFKATAAHISMVLGQPPKNIQFRQLSEVRSELRRHLSQRGLRRNSIRSYLDYVRMMLAKAKELGWSDCSPEIKVAWEPIRRVTSRAPGCSKIVRYAIRNGKRPSDFTEPDLNQWAEEAVRSGRRHEYIVAVKRRFRNDVFQAGLAAELPGLLPPRTGRVYGVPVSKFPEPLRTQTEDLLKWKTADFAPERPVRTKNRPISASSLRNLMSRLFGFLVGIKGRLVSDLRQLFDRRAVVEFVEWSINQRGKSPHSLFAEVGRIGGVRAFPGLDGQDFTWVPKLLAQLPGVSDSRVKENKDRKWVPHEVLVQIPRQICGDAATLPDLTEKGKALMAREALLMTLLTTLPWRQRNIREAKLMPFAEGGNISKEEIPHSSVLAKSKWVEDGLRLNPRQRFWQFYFRASETKIGRAVRGILPRQLLPWLEDYVDRHRSILIGQKPDPKTLFCGDRGHPLHRNDLIRIVGAQTMKYCGRRVNPHLFRDIFAVAWLASHPQDYLTLSKILWHSNINTTIRIYSRNYDESFGPVAVEQWLDQKERS